MRIFFRQWGTSQKDTPTKAVPIAIPAYNLTANFCLYVLSKISANIINPTLNAEADPKPIRNRPTTAIHILKLEAKINVPKSWIPVDKTNVALRPKRSAYEIKNIEAKAPK